MTAPSQVQPAQDDLVARLRHTRVCNMDDGEAICNLLEEAADRIERDAQNAKRLDWLERNTGIYRFLEDGSKQWFTGPYDMRKEIDAAMGAADKESGR